MSDGDRKEADHSLIGSVGTRGSTTVPRASAEPKQGAELDIPSLASDILLFDPA